MATTTETPSCISPICSLAFQDGDGGCATSYLKTAYIYDRCSDPDHELRTCSCCYAATASFSAQATANEFATLFPLIEYETPARFTCPPASVTEHVSVRPDDTSASPATEYMAPALAGTYTEPAPVIEHVSFAPDDTHAAPARIDSAPAIKYIAPASPQVNRDFRSLVNPQFSTTSGEVSASKVVGPLLHF